MFNVFCTDNWAPCSIGKDPIQGHPEIEADTIDTDGFLDVVAEDRVLELEYIKHPILAAAPSVIGNVRFVLASALRKLPKPWPRSQDLEEDVTKLPQADDFVIAISHSWPYQRHPDPLNLEKLEELVDNVIKSACRLSRPFGDFLVFYDFMSVPQVPFMAGQAPRSDEENTMVSVALRATPSIYMFADAVIHIKMDWTAVPGDGIEILVESPSLDGVSFWERNGQVQVEKSSYVTGGANTAAPFDIIVDLNGVKVTSAVSVRDSVLEGKNEKVRVRKAPFGEQNQVPCEDRGWIFFERFLAMVTVAMVDTDHAKHMQYSNSEEVLKEVFKGAEILRNAALRSSLKLHEELIRFNDILKQKQFFVSSDRDLVLKLMQDSVKNLAALWHKHASSAMDRRGSVTANFPRDSNLRPSVSQSLAAEVGDGKSYIDECPISGEVQRVVVVVALRCVDLNRRVFVHLARWDNGVVTPDIKLPGTKLHEGEDLNAAMHRLLCEELLPISHCIFVENPTLEVEWRESTKYKGIITKYVKNEYHASLDPHVAVPLLAETRKFKEADRSSVRRSDIVPQISLWSSSSYQTNIKFTYLPIKLLAYGDKLMLYAWLDPEDFAYLKSDAGRTDLRQLLMGLCIDDLAEQHAKELWTKCEKSQGTARTTEHSDVNAGRPTKHSAFSRVSRPALSASGSRGSGFAVEVQYSRLSLGSREVSRGSRVGSKEVTRGSRKGSKESRIEE